MLIKYLTFFLTIFCCAALKAQDILDCGRLLDKEPYFVRNKTLGNDSLLQCDIVILKHCGNFEKVDSVFLNGPMLGALMLDQVRVGKPATYRTLVDYFDHYKKTTAYRDFVKGLLLYQEMAEKKVDLAYWDTDKELFIRMGFTAADLEDFKNFLSGPGNKNLSYKAAFSNYMTEIEAMRVDK